MRRIAISLGLVGVLSLGAAACGSKDSSSTAASPTAAGTATPTTMPGLTTAAAGDHNDADVTFAQKMIPHHRQAITMSTMAMDSKAGASAAVKALATKISAAQTPEIDTMQGWLDKWAIPMSETTDMQNMGASTPMGTTMGGAMGGSDGMMSDTDMTALSAATGPAFDKMWLTGMIAHHQGAIAMANTEQQNGKNADAIKLADSIATGQTTEVTEMQQLLGAG